MCKKKKNKTQIVLCEKELNSTEKLQLVEDTSHYLPSYIIRIASKKNSNDLFFTENKYKAVETFNTYPV